MGRNIVMKGRMSLAAAAIVAGAVAFSTSVSANGDSAGTQEDPKQLVSERCTVCHDISMVTSRHASSEEWHEIVQRMISNGADVSEPQADLIANYLARTQGPTTSDGHS